MTNGPLADAIRNDLTSRREPLIVPYLIDVEVVNAVRGLTAGQKIDADRAAQVLSRLVALPAERCPHLTLLPRMWELRHKFTAYDATYIALAEAMDATLYTGDEKLTKGHRAHVRLFARQ